MINKFPNMIVIATKIDQHICAFELQYIVLCSHRSRLTLRGRGKGGTWLIKRATHASISCALLGGSTSRLNSLGAHSVYTRLLCANGAWLALGGDQFIHCLVLSEAFPMVLHILFRSYDTGDRVYSTHDLILHNSSGFRQFPLRGAPPKGTAPRKGILCV